MGTPSITSSLPRGFSAFDPFFFVGAETSRGEVDAIDRRTHRVSGGRLYPKMDPIQSCPSLRKGPIREILWKFRGRRFLLSWSFWLPSLSASCEVVLPPKSLT